MELATPEQVADALKRLGNYRVMRAQEEAEETPGIIGGWIILALGLRETWGRNIEGGAKLVNKRWVKEDDPTKMDVGWLQISRKYHADALEKMPGVRSDTWSPTIEFKTANVGGYVPRFTDSVRFTLSEMELAVDYGRDRGVQEKALKRFAVAAHNAGMGGALAGYQSGNVDKYTAGGDYSHWVMDARLKVGAWLAKHPNWVYQV